MGIINILSSTNYIVLNKDLLRCIGLNETVLLGELCSEYNYWFNHNKLINGAYFYATHEKIEKNTSLNSHFQRQAFSKLENLGIITSKSMGMPCRKYYSINEQKILELLSSTIEQNKLSDKNDSENTELESINNQDTQTDVHEVNDKSSLIQSSTICTTSHSPDERQDVHEVNDIINNNINNNINKKNNYSPNPSDDGRAAEISSACQDASLPSSGETNSKTETNSFLLGKEDRVGTLGVSEATNSKPEIVSKEAPKENSLEDFEKIWHYYPRKAKKRKAYSYYKEWLKGRKYLNKTIKFDNKEMWYAVRIYGCDVKGKEEQYIQLGSSFFNDSIYDYVQKYREKIDYWEKYF